MIHQEFISKQNPHIYKQNKNENKSHFTKRILCKEVELLIPEKKPQRDHYTQGSDWAISLFHHCDVGIKTERRKKIKENQIIALLHENCVEQKI